MDHSGNTEEGRRRPVSLSMGPADHGPVGLCVHGRYRIVGELATGALGTVCRAEDQATGHEVAVRLLPRDLFGASQAAPRARRGGNIVSASAAHPALVGVLEVGQAEDGRDFAAMELVEGRRLSEALVDGPLNVDVALRVALELGGAVENLHAAGLAHGALRPRNVVVDAQWRVKLLDVELCGLRGERVLRSSGGGEAPQEYLSLEQIRRSAVTEETDIYAFGVMLYEMLSGAPPFQASTREALLKKQVADTPVPLRRRRRAVPAAVETMVALALSKRPERRPTIQSVLNCLWHEVNRPAKRWKRTIAVAGGVALAVSIPVLVGWSLFSPGPLPQPTFVPPPAVTSPAAVEAPADPAPSPTPGAMSPEPRPVPPKEPAMSARPKAAPPVSQAGPSRTPTPERREQTRRPETPVSPAPQQGPAANSNDDPDPGAAVD